MSEQRKVKLNWQALPIELLLVVAYLLMGFLGKLWHPGWVLFFISPLYHWVVAVLSSKRVKGVPTTIAAILSVITFLLLGFLGNWWHPGWIVFFLIPITASFESFFAGGLRGRIADTKDKIRSKIMGDVAGDPDDRID